LHSGAKSRYRERKKNPKPSKRVTQQKEIETNNQTTLHLLKEFWKRKE